MSVHLYAPLLDRIYREHHLFPSIILHYDPEIRDLTIWFWYVVVSGDVACTRLQFVCIHLEGQLRPQASVLPLPTSGFIDIPMNSKCPLAFVLAVLVGLTPNV
jgi:hypothetical protein